MVLLSEIADFSTVILFVYFAFEMRKIYVIFNLHKYIGFR